jgi:formate hydrogenlyase subunit 3/multisubunit Na+/H+ antiporter MnhD subunit
VQPFGKTLILLGSIIVGVGLLLTFFDKIPLLGKLPGDIHFKRDNLTFYFPITTSIVLSVILSLVLWIISYFSKK